MFYNMHKLSNGVPRVEDPPQHLSFTEPTKGRGAQGRDMTIRASVDLEGVRPGEAFDQMVADLVDSLKTEGIDFIPGPNGLAREGPAAIGEVTVWNPPVEFELEWHTAAAWDPKDKTKVIVSFEPIEGGTRVTFENQGWGGLVGDRGAMLSEWFVDQALAPLIRAMSPKPFSTWLTDRRGRRPSGAIARAEYRNPTFHLPIFKAILHYLQLTPTDYMIEVGCGGGAFLKDALKSGCRAAAIDHSEDMVAVAKDLNSDAIGARRLEVLQSKAYPLPYPDETFSCAVSTSVFGFIDDPKSFLSEIHRVLRAGGRLVLQEGSKETRGTPATPEPIASQVHFYEDEELVELAKNAGFSRASVERPDLGPFAREAALPEDLVSIFSGQGVSQFLLATKAD